MHSIASVEDTGAHEGCFSKKLLPSSIVSNAIVPIVKEALAVDYGCFQVPDLLIA